MSCNRITCRDEWQAELAAANPRWQPETDYFAPDGDAKLRDEDVSRFVTPDCAACGGFIKPDVVFFGESVPRERVESAFEAMDRADALLVIGSSLMVFSGYRFARRAAETGKPIAILNRGRTRADDLAALRIDAECGDILDHVSRSGG
jgi:NAD-dependent SIR2 family protein deacetylase